MTRAISLLFLLAVVPSVHANEAARRPSEICRFRALDPENPFRRWLASQEVTCVAAGAPLDFESGLWNVFERAAGVITASPVLIDGDAEPASVGVELLPAATVTPLLPERHTGVFYAPRRVNAYPVDGARVSVPADEPLWLFVLDEKRAPVAVIPIAPLAPNTERSVDARNGGAASVIGWLHVPDADRSAIAEATGLSLPSINAGSLGADPLPSPDLLHGAFFRVRDVAPGQAELRLSGRAWVPDRRTVKVQPGVTLAAAPLLVRGAGTLMVHWNTNDDLYALHRALGECKEDDDDAPQLTVAVAKCPIERRGRELDLSACAEVRKETVHGTFGSMTFDDVVPGLYRAEMRFGNLPPVTQLGSVGPLRVSDLRVFADYYTIYGSVTRGGEPLNEAVRIEFEGGAGFAPADSSDYRAVFEPPPLLEEAQITVAACDGAPRAIVLADQPMRPRTRYDIDIPANELTVSVSDTFTHEQLRGAIVKLEALSVLRPHRVVFETKSTANEVGQVEWSGVPVRRIRLTVSHAGYQTQTVEQFTMPKSDAHTVDVQLVPLRGTRGRIVSELPFESGTVLWYSPEGSETERAELAPDGTFVYANRHTSAETMAVLSMSHPLWVLRAPAAEGRESISLRFPSAPSVAFDVWLAAAVPPNESRHIGVVIGGVRVPQPVLAQHQTLRRESSVVQGTGPETFRDLLATGPVDVLLGPTTAEAPPPARGRLLDLFALPQYADVPRQRLEPGATDVVFTLK